MKLFRREFIHAGCTVVAASLTTSIVDKAEAYFPHGSIVTGVNNAGVPLLRQFPRTRSAALPMLMLTRHLTWSIVTRLDTGLSLQGLVSERYVLRGIAMKHRQH